MAGHRNKEIFLVSWGEIARGWLFLPRVLPSVCPCACFLAFSCPSRDYYCGILFRPCSVLSKELHRKPQSYMEVSSIIEALNINYWWSGRVITLGGSGGAKVIIGEASGFGRLLLVVVWAGNHAGRIWWCTVISWEASGFRRSWLQVLGLRIWKILASSPRFAYLFDADSIAGLLLHARLVWWLQFAISIVGCIQAAFVILDQLRF